MRAVTLKDSGVISLRSDMTYSVSETLAATVDINYPLSCLGAGTCAQVDPAIQLDLAQNPDPDIKSVSCAGSSICVCRFVGATKMSSEAGRYTTSGSTLTTMPTGGQASSTAYCIDGSSAHFMDVSMSATMGPMGKITIEVDRVAQKQ